MNSGSRIVGPTRPTASDTIRLGLVGCGNRGSGACREALSTKHGPVELVAMGDLFLTRLETSLRNLSKYDDLRPRINVPPERRFVGFDAYQKVIEADVDMVLLATPPHFRPIHYAAAVKAGKHVFLEKPCCVDAPGYRQLLATNSAAKAARLSVVVGLQRRHQPHYLEKILKIRDGAVGRVQLVRTYFNMPGGREGAPKPPQMSEMEYQIRSWNLFCWLCGDHLVEQACHEIDVANWVLDGHPVRANGMGARQIRTGPGTGDIWDRHMIEFEYADGTRHYCQARQQPGTWSHVSDHVRGTRGEMTLGEGAWGLPTATPRTLRGKQFEGQNPYQREHDDWMASIRGSGPYRFEGDYGATSSMTAVMGRMATYSGKLVTWDEAVQSKLHLAPDHYSMDAQPPAVPDSQGNYPTAIPGVTQAW
jgi:myo-inositol 2-dehydrogenase / D-chiro-inositol 1-dehydrogenase